MADVITLSSEDEEEPVVLPPKKRVKLTTVSTKPDSKVPENSCIVVLDDDDDDCNEVKMDSETISEKNKSEKVEENGSSNDVKCADNQDDTKDAVVESEPVKVSTGNTELDSDNLNNSRLPLEATSKENDETENKFFAFLDDCVQAVKNLEHKALVQSKIPIIKKLYEKLKNLDQDLDELNEMIQNNAEKIKNMPEQTIICFSDVFQWLKSSYKDAANAKKSAEHNQKIIKKLEKALLKIRKRIRELEAAEINFDDEENSTYMQLDRYMTRASDIYTKLCKYREENPHHGCLLHCRLDFSSSKISEINKAINKKYKSNKEFPTYYDMDKCIRQCVQENKIKISEESIKYEVKHCFQELGKLLQRRRKMDLYNNQRSYIENTTDPAMENPDIVQKINANRSEANKKLEQVMEKYSRLQEKGVNPDVSSESEDSNMAESGSECEQDENATENI